MTTRDFADLLGLRGVWGRCASFCLMRILGLHRLNEIHRKVDGKKGPAFSEGALRELNITLDIPEEQLNLIPQTGGFITVSNHHFGAIDGLILSQVFGSRRPDYKILTNFFLSIIPGLKETFLPVNNFGGAPTARSINGLRMTLEHIGQERPLGLFPAGEKPPDIGGRPFRGGRHSLGRQHHPDYPRCKNAGHSGLFRWNEFAALPSDGEDPSDAADGAAYTRTAQ